MRVEQTALQLYTLREQMTTPAEFTSGIKQVAAIGYKGVQLGHTPPISPEDTAKLLSDNGLVCCSSHSSGEVDVLENPAATVDFLRKLECTSYAYPYPSGVTFDSLASVVAFAKRLNAAGKVFHEAGMSFAYHNHAIEFVRVDGRLVLDVIYKETDPQYVQGEPDTYWVQFGGGDPVGWCRKLKGRIPLLHLKDYKVTPKERPTFAEIGYGNLDWPEIVAAADEGGCEWYIVEQDRCDGDPFQSVRMSFDYMRDKLCS